MLLTSAAAFSLFFLKYFRAAVFSALPIFSAPIYRPRRRRRRHTVGSQPRRTERRCNAGQNSAAPRRFRRHDYHDGHISFIMNNGITDVDFTISRFQLQP